MTGKIMKVLTDKLFGYFTTQHGAYEYRNGWYRLPVCPFCGREEKFGIHLGKDRAHCFRCDYDEKLLQCIIDAENLKSRTQALDLLAGFKEAKYVEPKYEKVEERQVILPEGFKTLRLGDSRMAKMARAYVKGRGFDYKELSRRGVGYTDDSESKYWGYLIVPFHRDRQVVYFQTRKFFGTGPKFNNPLYEDFGIGKNQILYNADALAKHKEINVVESWTNAWTLSQNTISLNGKTLSMKQKTMLLQSKAETINILLDNDAWEYAIQLASEIIPYKGVRVIWFEDDRDVNDLGRKIVLGMIDNTPIINTFRELMILKHESHTV